MFQAKKLKPGYASFRFTKKDESVGRSCCAGCVSVGVGVVSAGAWCASAGCVMCGGLRWCGHDMVHVWCMHAVVQRGVYMCCGAGVVRADCGAGVVYTVCAWCGVSWCGVLMVW